MIFSLFFFVFQQEVFLTKMIEMSFFMTKFFVGVYKLTKRLKTIRKTLPMINVVINYLSNMTFLTEVVYKFNKIQGSPSFWQNLPVYLNKKI